MLTDHDLIKINHERQKRRQAALSREQAERALRDNGSDNSALEFLIGLSGFPYPSGPGIFGYALSDSGSGACSSSSDSSSSSSCDSSSSGGDGGGGGD